MNRTIITHDPATAKARIRFEHQGVTVEQDYQLDLVVPGSARIFEEMRVDFDETFQLKALEALTTSIKRQIEDGAITNAPTPEPVEVPTVEAE